MSRLYWILLASVLTVSTGETREADAESKRAPDADLVSACGPPPPGHPTKGRRDYNLMTADPGDLRDLNYHGHFHIQPATSALNSGNVRWDVMNNLHFVLHKVPNDHRALGLLVRWDKAGGKDPDYKSPACYLVWAASFAPTDPAVWNFGGYYFYQHKDLARAQVWWEQALTLDGGNAEVNYNLGLLNFEQRQYEPARKHAQAAYSAGYPLPGLRDKLKAAEEWAEPQPRASGD